MEARCPRGPGAATTVTPQGARTPTGLSKDELKWQLAEIDPAKETLQSGLRGGGEGPGNTKNCYPQGQESHATEQQTQHRHMVEQHMH